MSGIHPQFLLSKRFPVHTAIETQDTRALASLLAEPVDAQFYFSRKLPSTGVSILCTIVKEKTAINIQVSVLHQACCARTHPDPVWRTIVAVCLQLGAPVDDLDCAGQTPLFYAVTHCMAADIVPLLLAAGGLWGHSCSTGLRNCLINLQFCSRSPCEPCAVV